MKIKISVFIFCIFLILGLIIFAGGQSPLILPIDVKLNDLADLNIGTLTDTDIIEWDSTTTKWISATKPVTESSDIDHDATTNYLATQHLILPAGTSAVLTNHNKAEHDALSIDANTVGGENPANIVTNARVKAHFPDTIANILSDHDLATHTTLGLFDASADVDHDSTTNYASNQHVALPGTISNILSDHDKAAHDALNIDADTWDGYQFADYLDQVVKQTSSPTFEHLTLNNATSEIKTGGILQVSPSSGPAVGYLAVKGNGMWGTLMIYDSDAAEITSIATIMGRGYIDVMGVSPQGLYIQSASPQDVSIWPLISSGNPWFYIYGGIGGPNRYLRMQIESDGDGVIETQTGDLILTPGADTRIVGSVFMASIKAGTTQANAGAVAGELWMDTNDNNTIKIGS